ncbi:sigma-54-dependent transcriptional regulator [Bacillus sp. Marseille-Q3570]|uniref:sigma-54-dependent transcriptional regulator n=1 Tax=Bacillus sp. Marseille-Q3570 TaxID=2963522 RepID=UPI0021B7E600|nr:sigma-54-dependent transcriptional regulator [Bacillus sp. Marseille-Q3570]
MVIKTMFIAPYPSMVPLVEECKTDHPELDIQIEVGNLEEGAEIARWAEKNGYDVIISRGGTAQLIKSFVSISVIDVHLSGYDMLRTLTLANDFQGKKALVGFPNITIGAQSIVDLLELPIHVYSIQSAVDVDPLVDKLKEDGFEVVLGDVVTVDAAQKNGLEGILIQSGREAIYEAFSNACSEYEFHHRNQMLIKLLSKILKSKKQDILILDSKGEQIYENWSSVQRVPLSHKELKKFRDDVKQNGHAAHTVSFKNKQVEVNGELCNFASQSFIIIYFTVKEFSEHHKWLQVKNRIPKPVIIAESPMMEKITSQIRQSISKQRIYLLYGEKGTGKALMAEFIHYEQNNRGNLLTIDMQNCEWDQLKEVFNIKCSTVNLTNIEHLDSDRIDELREFVHHLLEYSITVILTSNVQVPDLIDNSLDDDTVELALPPLKQRKEDIKGLAAYFVAQFHQNLGTHPVKIREKAIEELINADWNENVSELKRFIKSLVLGEKGYVIEPDHVQSALKIRRKTTPKDNLLLRGTLEEIEQRVIEKVLEEEGFNQSKAAKRLGINRSTLWRKLRK